MPMIGNPLTDPDEFLFQLALSPPRTFVVPPNATIQLREGAGHLLEGATICGWVDN
jgi:hypothetical protein